MIKRPMGILCFVFVITMYVILSLLGGVDEAEHLPDYTNISVVCSVNNKILKNDKYSIHVDLYDNGDDDRKGVYRKKAKVRYIAYVDEDDFDKTKIGQVVYITGTYMNFSAPVNEGEFNMRRHYRIRNYDGFITNSDIKKAGSKYNKFRNRLYEIKERTKQIYFSNISENEAGTLSAMVLGDKSELNDEVKSAYQNAGISHVLSLSGLHIATVGMCLYKIIFSLGTGTLATSILSATVMISYGIMTGMSTSTIRALIMFIMGLVAKNIGRTYDLLSAAYLSIILILFENPYYVYDSGFLLSCFSVFGIGMLYPILDDISEIMSTKFANTRFFNHHFKIIKKVLKSEYYEKIRQSICISLSTMLFTLPVIMNNFYKTSRYGVFINLIVVPLMGVILGLGIVSGILGNVLYYCYGAVGKSDIAFEMLIELMLTLTEKVLILYTFLSEKFGNAYKNTWVTGKADEWQNIVYIIILVIAYVAFELFKGRENVDEGIHGTEHDITELSARRINIKKYVCDYRKVCTSVIIVALLLLTYRKKPDFEIDVLSVGQGACNVIYGNNIPTIMIDGGSTDEKDVGKYKITPFLLSKGIGRLDYVFISHPDEDHVSGIIELLGKENNDIDIRRIIMSTKDGRIIELAREKSLEVFLMEAGNKITSGNVTIQCVSPDKTNKALEKDINDISLVLKLEYSNGFSAIFPGDISSDVEKRIISDKEMSNIIKQSDFLSAPHHGSKNSSCQEFLETINPRITTISAGKNNSYGHPHKETLERLDKFAPKSKVLRTDESGQIMVTVIGDRISISKFISR